MKMGLRCLLIINWFDWKKSTRIIRWYQWQGKKKKRKKVGNIKEGNFNNKAYKKTRINLIIFYLDSWFSKFSCSFPVLFFPLSLPCIVWYFKYTNKDLRLVGGITRLGILWVRRRGKEDEFAGPTAFVKEFILCVIGSLWVWSNLHF